MEISDDAYQMLKNDWTMWCVLNMFKGGKNTKSTRDANLCIKKKCKTKIYIHFALTINLNLPFL